VSSLAIHLVTDRWVGDQPSSRCHIGRLAADIEPLDKCMVEDRHDQMCSSAAIDRSAPCWESDRMALPKARFESRGARCAKSAEAAAFCAVVA